MSTTTRKANGIPKGATCIVTLPDGTQTGRKTRRFYTHAIALKTRAGDARKYAWEVHYCGSLLLAQRLLASAAGWQAAGAVILPVEQADKEIS